MTSRQVLRIPREELDSYQRWIDGVDESWKKHPCDPYGILKCWYLYWPDGCYAELKLLAPDDEGAVFIIVVCRNDGMVLWSQKETEGIEGLYYGPADDHEILIIDETDSEEDWE